MKTSTEEISAELAALESRATVLETQARARGLNVPLRPDVSAAKQMGATLDELFTAICAMESHAAKLRVTTRLATPLAYAPKATPQGLTPTQQIEAAGGVVVMGLKSEIERLKATLPTLKSGSATALAVEDRISYLSKKLAVATKSA